MSHIARHAYCSWCANPWPTNTGWPRTCPACKNTSYINPLPVAVILLPVDQGVLMVRRGIEPRKGQLAMPGGFIDVGESWQEACARELFEETRVLIDPGSVEDLCTLSAPDGTVLVFGVAPRMSEEQLPEFVPNQETRERVVIPWTDIDSARIAFPLHAKAIERFIKTTTFIDTRDKT